MQKEERRKKEPGEAGMRKVKTAEAESTMGKRDGFRGERMMVLPTEAFLEYARHPLVRRLYLTDVGFFPSAAHHYRERREGIEENIFLYCLEGRGLIEVQGKTYELQEREAFCIPAGSSHRYYADSQVPWSILWVHFKGEDTEQFPLKEYRVVHFLSENASNRMIFLFELLFKVLEGNYTLGNFIYISQVLSLILSETYYREKQDTAAQQNRYVTRVIRYMYRHLEENLTMEQIEEEFQLSKSYLHGIFKKYTGRAPMDFYSRLKMTEACKLLRSTDLYIYQVAHRLGYKDQYYFSRIFTKTVGLSPKEYRQSDCACFEGEGRAALEGRL